MATPHPNHSMPYSKTLKQPISTKLSSHTPGVLDLVNPSEPSKGLEGPQLREEMLLKRYRLSTEINPYHPWDWYIYLHEWLIFMENVTCMEH